VPDYRGRSFDPANEGEQFGPVLEGDCREGIPVGAVSTGAVDDDLVHGARKKSRED
jgi:hypothetical protein